MNEPRLNFPFDFDARGRAAVAGPDEHVRDMIQQVLFTNPGERVNRPDFGCGLLQLVFMPNSDVLSTATQFLVRGALERWLSDVVQVEDIRIESVDERLSVDVVYSRRDDGRRVEERFLSP